MATICLNMIVKNESDIIIETLNNILSYVPIDYWVIADTGSIDNTPQKIRDFFAEKRIEGKLLHHKWINFGHNRQMALDAAYGMSDYVLIFDADDRFVGCTRIMKAPKLTLDGYSFLMKNHQEDSHSYHRNLLIKNNRSWKWMGAVHEQLISCQRATISLVNDMTVISGRFGARNKDPNKYLNDAKMLEDEFFETDNEELKVQDAYFCAQSFHDAGLFEKEFEWLNIVLNFSLKKDSLRHYAIMRLAECCKRRNKNDEMIKYLNLAYENSPQNAEPLILLAKYFQNINELDIAYSYVKKSIDLPVPHLLEYVNIDYDLFNYERYNLLCDIALKLGYYEDLYIGLKSLLFKPHSSKKNVPTLLSRLCLPEIIRLLSLENDSEIIRIIDAIRHLKSEIN